jgi:hypothetical protein
MCETNPAITTEPELAARFRELLARLAEHEPLRERQSEVRNWNHDSASGSDEGAFHAQLTVIEQAKAALRSQPTSQLMYPAYWNPSRGPRHPGRRRNLVLGVRY